MKKKNVLTSPEWDIMETLWDSEPKLLSEVIADLKDKFHWSYTTYSTYMSLLVKKGALQFRTRGHNKFYYPAISREECIRGESASIIEKLGKKNAQRLLVCMIQDVGLSSENEAYLENLVESLSDNDNREE